MADETILPELQGSLLCEDVRQEMNGVQTLVGVLNAIPSPSFPVRVMKLCLWSRWCSGVGEFTQTSRIVAPDNETIIAESKIDFSLRQIETHTTNVHFFAGTEFTEPGGYHIEIYLDQDLVLRYPVPVLQIPQPQQE